MNIKFKPLCVLTASVLAGCTAISPSTNQQSATPARVADGGWYAQGQAAVQATANQPARPRTARNVILFIGDGMSLDTITAARIFAGQKAGGPGEDHLLHFETLPHTALMKTYTTDTQVPDSAGTATAMLTGSKTKSGFISVAAQAEHSDCAGGKQARLTTFLEQMEARGKATGVVSTARITHATPAVTYAHVPNRNWEYDGALPADAVGECLDIAKQLIAFDAGDGIDVILGGGRRAFLPATAADPEYADKTGSRKDGQNLVRDWQSRYGTGARYVWNATQLAQLDASKTERVLGLFEPSHMMFEADRVSRDADEPSLAELTDFAIERLATDGDGYFLLVEGGRIDHAHHGGNAARALSDTVAFDEAVARALAAVDLNETLIIVTADHGHVMSFSGYPKRGNPILGKVVEKGFLTDGSPQLARDKNGLPYTALSYANGPGHRHERPDLSDVDTTDVNYRQEATVPLSSETHSGTDVIVYAAGPGANLFRGVQEQTYVYHVMRHAVDAR